MSEVQQLKNEIARLRTENMYKERQFDEMRCEMEHDRECSLRQMEEDRRKMECRCREIECRYEQEIRRKNCEIDNLRRQVSDLQNRLRH